jgi:hypothetical protein
MLKTTTIKTFLFIACKNHHPTYQNMAAILSISKLVFSLKEPNSVSLGRGTDKPFQIYGSDVFSG